MKQHITGERQNLSSFDFFYYTFFKIHNNFTVSQGFVGIENYGITLGRIPLLHLNIFTKFSWTTNAQLDF